MKQSIVETPAFPGAGPSAGPSASRWPAAAIVALFYLAALPLILSGRQVHRPSFDQDTYHRPTIEQFARQLPTPDLTDYPSATTPGYHLVLAMVHAAVEDVRVLRLAASLFTAGLLATLAIAMARHVAPTTAFVLCLPLVASTYVLSSGAWLLPDNAAWWGVLGVLLVALRPRVDAKTHLLGGLILLALVFVRQIHLWAAAVLWVAAWRGEPNRPQSLSQQVRRLGAMAAATLPASLLVGGLYLLWGGPTPPGFSQQHAGANPAVPAMILAVFAVLGVFYVPFLHRAPDNWRRVTGNSFHILAGVVFGLIVGIVPETSYNYAAGRASGIWNLVPYLPTVADRSPLMILLSSAGGGFLALWWGALPRRDGWIFLAAWIAFILAQSANAQAWQRYYEPFALIMLALAAARVPQPQVRPLPLWLHIGPVLLTALLLAVTLREVL